MDKADYLSLYRYLVTTLNERGEITDLDVEFLASRGFDREDIEIILNFFKEMNVIKIDRAGRRAVLVSKSKLRKIIELLKNTSSTQPIVYPLE